MAPLKCAAGGEHKWKEITAAGSNFSSISLGLVMAALGPEQSGHLKSYVEKSVILITLFLVRSSRTTTTCTDRANTTACTVLWWYCCGEITYWCHNHTRFPVPALSYHSATPYRFQSALDEGWNHSFQHEAFRRLTVTARLRKTVAITNICRAIPVPSLLQLFKPPFHLWQNNSQC